jgi:signal transduction histidine kinase
MESWTSNGADTGLVVLDLISDHAFAQRRPHMHDVAAQIKGMNQLAQAFVGDPETILQVLVDAAVDLCGAESAGISIERKQSATKFYEWVATAGQYKRFLNAMLPLYPSACGVCLERGGPQILRVSQRFFDLMGIEAPIVTDGILLPWQVNQTRGTFWIMAHKEPEAFDQEDLRVMQALADFVAMAVEHQRQQAAIIRQGSAAAAAKMANDLAHEINNPLQSLMNLVYVASESDSGGDAKALAEELSDHVLRLSLLVGKILQLPCGPDHTTRQGIPAPNRSGPFSPQPFST